MRSRTMNKDGTPCYFPIQIILIFFLALNYYQILILMLRILSKFTWPLVSKGRSRNTVWLCSTAVAQRRINFDKLCRTYYTTQVEHWFRRRCSVLCQTESINCDAVSDQACASQTWIDFRCDSCASSELGLKRWPWSIGRLGPQYHKFTLEPEKRHFNRWLFSFQSFSDLRDVILEWSTRSYNEQRKTSCPAHGVNQKLVVTRGDAFERISFHFHFLIFNDHRHFFLIEKSKQTFLQFPDDSYFKQDQNCLYREESLPWHVASIYFFHEIILVSPYQVLYFGDVFEITRSGSPI